MIKDVNEAQMLRRQKTLIVELSSDSEEELESSSDH